MSDSSDKGLYEKFKVERTDGRSAKGEKHHGCRYFVLDLDHDKHAWAALAAYAESCKDEFPQLSADLKAAVEHKSCTGSPFFDGHQHRA